VLGYFARLQESGAAFTFEVHELLADDEHAVALLEGAAERSGKRTQQKVVHVFQLNADGRSPTGGTSGRTRRPSTTCSRDRTSHGRRLIP
jgi:hypothetical protein